MKDSRSIAHGIVMENGVTKLMNSIINECARSMRLDVGLPPTFWVDAVRIAIYLIEGH